MNERQTGWRGIPVMRQTWGGLLFLHWPIPSASLRPLVSPELEIENFDGTAWVGLTPFSMWGIAPSFLPPLPLEIRSLEINVRTYVRLGDLSGIWFLSLDAANPLVVYGARLGYGLPYFHARMSRNEAGENVLYTSSRIAGPPAEFRAEWRLGDPLPPTSPGTLEYFLTERYVLFSTWRGKLVRAHIRHRQWPLRQAVLEKLSSTMLQAHGVNVPKEDPHLLAQFEPLHVQVGAPAKIG